MFAAYFDDSGTHDDTATQPGSQIVAAAGYVARPAVWEPFEDKWNAFLRREGLSSFHAVDCAAERGAEYEGRGKPECNRLHRAAVTIITSHNLVAVGYAGVKAAFNEMYHRAVPEESARKPKASYYNALVNAWRLLGRYVNTTKLFEQARQDELVAIVMEDAPKRYAYTLSSYDAAIEAPEHLLHLRRHFAGPPSFKRKEGHPQIQAADVLAYEVALTLRRMVIPGEVQRRRESYNVLIRHAHEQALNSVSYHLLRFDTRRPVAHSLTAF
jgi:hypothetical protein